MKLFIFFHNIIFFNAIQGCVKNSSPENQEKLLETPSPLRELTSDSPKAKTSAQIFSFAERSNDDVDSSREDKKKEKMEDFSRKKYKFLKFLRI